MKDIIKNIKNHYKWGLLVFVAGMFLGWLLFGAYRDDKPISKSEIPEQGQVAVDNTIWTCSMHPQIRQDKPGKCPICAMDLIPLSDLSIDDALLHPDEIQMTASAASLADIQTQLVRNGTPNREIYLQGKVQPDERRIAQLTARFGGRIEKLFISFTGENVVKGAKLATIYSPELLMAQRELLEALQNKESRPSLYQAARSKLKLWDLTEQQIDAIEQYGEPRVYFDVLSPISGTVTNRHVASGDYLKEGSPLFEVIDLAQVWIMFDAYETDLPWISVGDNVTYNIQSVPGKSFKGKVSYIDPFINPETRVAKVRVQQLNPDLMLKPEMFVRGNIESRIAGNSDEILIPKSSILWTGKRAIVYVKIPGREQPTFQYREVVLGPEAGNFYVVHEGINEGEEIAVNGVFKIDAAAQLAGKKSMMNPDEGESPVFHDHSNMDLDGKADGKVTDSEPDPARSIHTEVAPEFKKQLSMIYLSYLVLKNALVGSDPINAGHAAISIQQDLKSINLKLWVGKAGNDWSEDMNQLIEALKEIQGTEDLYEQRRNFSMISEILYNNIKTFGIDYPGHIYYQYCPMAIEDQGAYWLSEIEEINNPYFGEMMLRCGETRDVIQ